MAIFALSSFALIHIAFLLFNLFPPIIQCVLLDDVPQIYLANVINPWSAILAPYEKYT